MNISINPYRSQIQYSKHNNVNFESRPLVQRESNLIRRWLEKYTDYGLWPGSSRAKVYRLSDYGLKVAQDLKLTPFQKELFAKVAAELKNMKNMNLLTYGTAWGSLINPVSNPNLLLMVEMEDINKMIGNVATLSRMSGLGGKFELSILGTDKKALINVPAEELTKEMTVIDRSMQAGIHPFLVDMTKFLDSHPEIIAEIESYVGEIDLSNVDSDIVKKINTSLISYLK